MMKKVLAALASAASLSAFAAPDCQKTGMVCTTPNQIRNVSGLSVSHECWGYQDIYQCRSQSMVNDCQPLRDKGYSQIGSSCMERDDSGACVIYEQKYNCPDKPEAYIEKAVCDQGTFCQNGGAGCFDTGAPPDENFGQAAVIVEVAREAGVYDIDPSKVEILKDYMEGYSIKVLGSTTLKSYCKSVGGGTAFSNYALLSTGMKTAGETDRESIVLSSKYMYDSLYGQLDSSLVDKGLGAMNSWASGLGDGVFNPQFGFYGFTFELTSANGFQFVGFDPCDFALPVAIMPVQERLSCDSAEQVVAMKHDQNLCVHIETYCSKKVLKVCVKKKERHYCFNSKLTKIINRQGCAQLGMPMNSCGDFNQVWLQVLNFSRIDLSEFIADIVPKDVPASTINSRVQQVANKRVRSHYDQ